MELGIGRFGQDSASSFQIRENLVLACLIQWLYDSDSPMNLRTLLNLNMESSNASSRGFEMENVLIYIFWMYFSGEGCTLDSVFEFNSEPEPPVWSGWRAQLVSHFDAEGNPVVLERGFTTGLGVTGKNATATARWLNRGPNYRVPFLKPDTHMGPDICLYVVLTCPDSDLRPVLIITIQSKLGKTRLSKKAARRAIFTTSPEHFYAKMQTVSDVMSTSMR